MVGHPSFQFFFVVYHLYLYCIVYRALYCSRRAKPVQSAADLVLVSYLYLDYAACQTKQIYKRSIAGQTWVEITPEGLTYDKAELKQTFPWEEIAGIALYKTYCLYEHRKTA